MMYIVFRDEAAKKEREIEWHVNTPLPIQKDFERIHLIQTDGDELNALEAAFDNIPKIGRAQSGGRLKQVITYRGEIAQFIFDNLPRSLTEYSAASER